MTEVTLKYTLNPYGAEESKMARSKTMERGREKEIKAALKFKPAKKLVLAAKLSDFCLELMKAGAEAKKRVVGKKS